MNRLIACGLAALLALPAFAAADKSWVQQSDQNSQIVLNVLAEFNPEVAANLGVDGYDTQIVDLEPRLYERNRDANDKVLAELRKRREAAAAGPVREDLDILIATVEQNQQTAKLNNELTLPYFALNQLVFQGLRTLVDPRVPKERQASAVERLKRYAGMSAEAQQPIATLAQQRMSERFGDNKLIGPFKGQVEQDLADTQRYSDGLRDLFAKSGLTGWEAAMDALAAQLKAHDEWVTKEILPRARDDYRQPPALYADNLKQVGVDADPEELIRRASIDFAELRSQMQALAPLVAKAKGIKSNDYHDVIAALKKKQITGDAILPLYRERLRQIEKLIRANEIITLPSREAKIRLASEAESAAIPAPFMSPPRLIGNTGEYAEFVLPLNVPGKAGRKDLRMDDFTYDSAAWTLTAHEARPGHELQFASMMERGVSIARAVFAFNSANIEGWGLYAESEMKPYLPLDGQLIVLQLRLMRAARAILDPMLNLGRITPADAHEFLTREVVLSDGMAQQEVDRYTFRAPGQATAYFYGYQALMKTRQSAQIALGKRFDRKRFNDFVIGQGLLPPKLLEAAVMEQFVPAEQKRTGG